MITKQEAREIVRATSYRDWSFDVVSVGQLDVWGLLGLVHVEMDGKIAVVITYQADNSDESVGGRVENKIHVAIPLTETPEQFARALYEMVAVIEEHERREFFRVELNQIRNRRRDPGTGNRALFHPHGVNRNRLFHDLDAFASGLKVEAMDGTPMTADAV